MIINQFDLLKTRRFFPLFLTQFLGAFNDNLYKSALAILITYLFATETSMNSEILITIAALLFILPYFLFSATAGQIADKYEKSRLIRYTKIAELLLMIVASVGLYLHNIYVLMSVLFLLGTQAAFFGPLKYSILPDHLNTDELIGGNALIESGTFLAILLGTLLGGFLASAHIGPMLVAIIGLFIAGGGFAASLSIPKATVAAPNLKINLNFIHESWAMVAETFKNIKLYLVILGISWFWLIGATYLSQFPTYVKNTLGAAPSVVTLLLTCFTAGIGIGSSLCNRLLKGRIHATYVPLAALGMSIFAIDLVIASRHSMINTGQLITLTQFLTYSANWRILIDLLLLAVCGGIYIVPLYTILQYESDPSKRSRAIASNNIMNALFMVVAAVLTSVMLFIHMSITQIFMVIAIANLAVAICICYLLPEELVKSFVIWLCKICYRVEVRGRENYVNAGDRVLIVANHTSFLDAVVLAAFLPDRLTFAIDTNIAKKWWMKLSLKLVNTYSVDPTNPLATKSIIEKLRENQRIVIFPEGRITVTGALMKIYEGPGLIADKADAVLLPIRIDGAQYTPFSYLRGKVKIRFFPKITLTILKPRKFAIPAAISGRERRQLISAQLYDIMTDTIFLSSNTHETLFQSVLTAKSIHGNKHLIVEDIERTPLNYQRLVLSSLVLGRMIAKNSRKDEKLGILLPNSVANVVTFFAMQAYHRVPAMINFTSGLQNVLAACETVNLRYIYTSRRFIDLAGLQPLADGITASGVKLIYLEDVRARIGIFRKLFGKLVALFPQTYYRYVNDINKENARNAAIKPAVVLFTSGSEGTPKGVALSHENIQSNRFQLVARVDFQPQDRVFNALPMFHSFGLCSATVVPVISGMRVFMYPSPLHYRIIPELCYDTNATILFGTDSFLSNYGKYAHPYNFYSLRYIFAGAEKLHDTTRQYWMQKFGIRIMEGYGATEAAPVISTNTTMQYKPGTVGRLLPCMNYKLESVPGILDGSRLFVSGPNIMLGYMYPDQPNKIIPPVDGWHDTGDIVAIDEEDYITIKGRAKRFAKIAGEMISLTAVEEEIYSLWPDYKHAILSKEDERKGEQLILITNNKNAELNPIIMHFKQHGIPEISLPRQIIYLDELPVLGSGKVDYQAVKNLI